jgi:hypothetical protein
VTQAKKGGSGGSEPGTGSPPGPPGTGLPTGNASSTDSGNSTYPRLKKQLQQQQQQQQQQQSNESGGGHNGNNQPPAPLPKRSNSESRLNLHGYGGNWLYFSIINIFPFVILFFPFG